MKRRACIVSSAVIAALIGATANAASDSHSSRFGTAVSGDNGRLVKIHALTRHINAEHFEVLILESRKGQRFAWRFDTAYAPTGFPLRKIAPPGFESGTAWIYVDHPARHVATD